MKSKYVRTVREAGNSIAVTIPSEFKIFEPGDEVWVKLEENMIIISKVEQ